MANPINVQPTRTYLEEALDDISCELLADWLPSDLNYFSITKNLYPHQVNALQNAVKVLYCFYGSLEHADTGTAGKHSLFNLCLGAGLDINKFNEYDIKNKNEKSDRFLRLKDFYEVKTASGTSGSEYIEAFNFFNRACFWMATASGKTLVLIKLIEIMHCLIKKELIPNCEFMVLFPTEDIEDQFAKTVDEYNTARELPVRLISLKDYEEEKNNFSFFNEIKVYSYRSDLLSDEEKTRRVNTMTFDNKGQWYVFLDEAHKGDKEDSTRQDYVTVLSRNGFSFNFSATFTEEIDFATTCYNYNLEKFINGGYGKNIYLTMGKFAFNKNLKEDFDTIDKQVQVLKSFIVFTLIKQCKEEAYYHDPLLLTLVNTVQGEDADLFLFFKVTEQIAENNIKITAFNKAKTELIKEFAENKQYQFGKDLLSDYTDNINSITIDDILKNVFNADTPGTIEYIEGENNKEFALKLKTCEKFFALIYIGDASVFINKNLKNYNVIKNYDNKKFFENINSDNMSGINLLIGSRKFYEGWDSNRPNVINYINIGSGEAKKYVLQSIGRGVRIQPDPNEPNKRTRLSKNDSHYRQLLETLFIFATNRKAVMTILDTLEAEKANEEHIELKENPRLFDLLIPEYSTNDYSYKTPAMFLLAEESFDSLKKYFSSFNEELLLLKYPNNLNRETYKRLNEFINKTSKLLFKFDSSKPYSNTEDLLGKIIKHIQIKEKKISGIKYLQNEIIHFKHIKIDKNKWKQEEINTFMELIQNEEIDLDNEIDRLHKQKAEGSISAADFLVKVNKIYEKQNGKIKDLLIKKISEHYYTPLIYSKIDKADYIKKIININSESEFIEKLMEHAIMNKKEKNCDWMFSKINQNTDSINIPYFDYNDNTYRDYYPDFIFWQKSKNSNDYKITFADPKSINYTSYQCKIDYFEKLFFENGVPKVFKFKNFNVTFDIKLISDNSEAVSDHYKKWWLDTNDFSWLEAPFIPT